MADAKTTLEIIIAATDSTASGFNSVGGKLSDLANAASDISAPFADLAKGVLAVDAALVALTVGGLAQAVKASGEFSGQFAEITTIIDATAGQIDTFRGDILNYSKDSVKSLDDISLAVYEAISTGVKYEDSLKFARTAEELAVGGKADLAASVKVLISSLNAYGAATDEATAYSDALFVAVKYGATTVPELAQHLAMVTNIAATAGVSFDELLAAIAALTATGMPTSMAIESIRSVLANVIKPSEMAQKEAERLGLQFDAAALKSKGLAGFLTDLNTATGGNIASTSKLIGDVTGLNAAMTLTGNGAKTFALAMEEMKTKAGASAAAYKIMVDQYDQVNQQLANNVKVVLIGVGDKIKDEYATLVNSLTTILKALGTAVDSGTFDGLFKVIEDAMGKASKALNGIATALPEALKGINFSGLIDSIGDVGGAINKIFGGLDLTKPADLRKAIQQVIDSLESLVRFSGSMATGVAPLIGAVIKIVEAFNSLDDDGKAAVGTLTGLMTAVSLAAIPLGALGAAVTGLSTVLSLTSVAAGFTAVSVAGLIAAAASVGTVVAAVVAIAGTVYLITTGIYDLTGAGVKYKAILAEIEAGQRENATGAEKLARQLATVSTSTGLTITSMDQLNKLQKDGVILYDEATGAWKKQGEAVKLTAEELKKLTDEALATGPPMKALATAADVNIASFTDLKTGVVDLTGYYMALGRADSGPIAKTTSALDAVAKQSQETETKLLELASNEKIKAMEFTANIQIADIAAQKDIILGAFDSINKGIEDTGKTYTGLWDLVGSTGGSASRDLEDAIKREEGRRQDSFDLQKKLTEAEIQLMGLKSKFYEKSQGGIEITISGGSPLMQYVVEEVFREAKVAVNADGGAYLLGL